MAGRQQGVQALRVEGATDRLVGEDGLGLAREQHAGACFRPVERLDADAVAREVQNPLLAVPERDREHALEPLECAVAPGEVGVGDRLGVAGGAERDPVITGELAPQFGVVVELAIVADDDAAGGVGQRLAAELAQVPDREAAMPETDRPFVPDAAAVRAAMGQKCRHARERRQVDRPAVPLEQAGHAAHRAGSLLSGRKISGLRRLRHIERGRPFVQWRGRNRRGQAVRRVLRHAAAVHDLLEQRADEAEREDDDCGQN